MPRLRWVGGEVNCSDEEAMAAWEAKYGSCVCLPDLCLAEEAASFLVEPWCELCASIDPELPCPNEPEDSDG
jgi:hypothetical protein